MLLRTSFLAIVIPALAEQKRSPDVISSLDADCLCPIYTALSQYTFASGPTGGSYNHSIPVTTFFAEESYIETTTNFEGICNRTVEVASMYASARARCDGSSPAATISFWQELCDVDLSSIDPNGSRSYDSIPILDPDVNTTASTGTIKSPVLLSESYYKRAYKTCVIHEKALGQDIRFGWGLVGYWGAILGLGIVQKILSFWTIRRTMDPRRDTEANADSGPIEHKQISRPLSSTIHALRTHIVVPASFTPKLPHHQRLLYGHCIPKRLDLIIVFGFWLLCVLLACVNYDGDTRMSTMPQRNWHYSSDRTGILAYACLPFLWLFSGRNNIFLWVTNFDIQSFNTFHRHIAWACTLLAIVHSIGYSIILADYEDAYHEAWSHKPWYMGVIAVVAMSVLLIHSITWLRRKWYEIFLISHIVLAIIIIYALFQHTRPDGPQWNPYLWTVVAIWTFDRILRVLRIAYCNLRTQVSESKISLPSSTVTYAPDSDLMTIDIEAPSHLTPKPGQHYFLSQPLSVHIVENHPFALGAYYQASCRLPKVKSKLTFYVRPYNGWTKSLRDRCIQANNTIHPLLLLEGPYGHTAPLHTFDTALLIAGGTGIAATLPYILDYAARLKRQTTETTRVHLIWSARQNGMFSTVFTEKLSHVLECQGVQVSFFCTGSALASPIESDKEVAVRSETKAAASDMRFYDGRPDIRGAVETEAEMAHECSTRLAVLCSGPGMMADECRLAVYEAMRRGCRGIRYFEEAFTW
ncbi:ferric reductase family protein [Aspergillus tubingensis]|uniref:Ferric reductase transmembrane component 4 n=1 Tax=Aspergillus niger TaxID=5061 RepID=A0A100I6U3_ASPNG|nr:ferric reductase transmembrane component 4 precursor [Aspergillus tubingensis]GAQ35739.1 ferric reductase transmembrane component 4 precursor [Aspergillus niger]GFN14102.1 ferric reductase transmembrane component 4 precursor [Aspergillus tubingensis]